jgi:hypothetical protein
MPNAKTTIKYCFLSPARKLGNFGNESGGGGGSAHNFPTWHSALQLTGTGCVLPSLGGGDR